ncbi:hypothetical protein EPIR_3039 [Erwinia piriflorinigrans CFBP 5888]|uniref:Uncharacterized protein n=1 Tax=Erwinia piriflorinigrans CFBP 5888 TaxID=1161919 RepID=V5ZBT3_9GAMM|nr:hypothetical protein EPIR_3039 [Erwinia piriflorinigrans CFBP 5888]
MNGFYCISSDNRYGNQQHNVRLFVQAFLFKPSPPVAEVLQIH